MKLEQDATTEVGVLIFSISARLSSQYITVSFATNFHLLLTRTRHHLFVYTATLTISSVCGGGSGLRSRSLLGKKFSSALDRNLSHHLGGHGLHSDSPIVLNSGAVSMKSHLEIESKLLQSAKAWVEEVFTSSQVKQQCFSVCKAWCLRVCLTDS